MTARFRSGAFAPGATPPFTPQPTLTSGARQNAPAAAMPPGRRAAWGAVAQWIGPLGAGIGALAGVVFGALIYMTPP